MLVIEETLLEDFKINSKADQKRELNSIGQMVDPMDNSNNDTQNDKTKSDNVKNNHQGESPQNQHDEYEHKGKIKQSVFSLDYYSTINRAFL